MLSLSQLPAIKTKTNGLLTEFGVDLVIIIKLLCNRLHNKLICCRLTSTFDGDATRLPVERSFFSSFIRSSGMSSAAVSNRQALRPSGFTTCALSLKPSSNLTANFSCRVGLLSGSQCRRHFAPKFTTLFNAASCVVNIGNQ